MRHANRIATVCLLLLFLFVLKSHSSQGAKSASPDPLTQQVNNYIDTGDDFRIMVAHLTQKYGIPAGMDLENPSKRDFISVHISHGTVAEVLNAIVAQKPGYKWTEMDSVVNIMPQSQRDSILDVRIADFHIANANFFEIHAAIVSLPEVKRWLEQNHFTEATSFAGIVPVGPNGLGLARVSLDLHDVTLREILNKTIKSPGFSSWIIGRWGEKNQYLSISVH
ncbi:MAG: hypothetical protein WCE61_21595 [Candidatus Acidiferrum sp.]